MVVTVAVDTTWVGRLNVCEVEPAATVTLVEEKAAVDPVRLTAAPLPVAGPFRVTVTLTLLPPTSEVGETPTEETASGTRLTLVVRDELPSVAVMVAVWVDGMLVAAVIVKLADVAFAATVAEVGTVSRVLLSES
jgi:hypothetical protein